MFSPLLAMPGIEPSQATAALHQRFLAGDLTPPESSRPALTVR